MRTDLCYCPHKVDDDFLTGVPCEKCGLEVWCSK